MKNQLLLHGGMDDSDAEYLSAAYLYGQQHSHDPVTRLGAVVVQQGGIVGIGANRFPVGVEVHKDRLLRPVKYSFMDHAETQALWNTYDSGNSPRGGVMYAPWFACDGCAKAIIGSGIREIVGHKPAIDAYTAQHDRRDWEKSIAYGLQMFKEAGIETRLVEEPIGGLEIMLHGKIVRP